MLTAEHVAGDVSARTGLLCCSCSICGRRLQLLQCQRKRLQPAADEAVHRQSLPARIFTVAASAAAASWAGSGGGGGSGGGSSGDIEQQSRQQGHQLVAPHNRLQHRRTPDVNRPKYFKMCWPLWPTMNSRKEYVVGLEDQRARRNIRSISSMPGATCAHGNSGLQQHCSRTCNSGMKVES